VNAASFLVIQPGSKAALRATPTGWRRRAAKSHSSEKRSPSHQNIFYYKELALPAACTAETACVSRKPESRDSESDAVLSGCEKKGQKRRKYGITLILFDSDIKSTGKQGTPIGRILAG
jgi:hypothetical protein